ncbi:MAG TPA: carbon-nitrogen hydrolase family protein, partial [Planctomycetota bacterium]|nr:carbon-nitrogen hydrolase family protein [Planctomycetota bacterium]
MSDTMRVAAVQFDMRPVATVPEFLGRCSYFVEAAAGYAADVLLFPELFTNPLLPCIPGTSIAQRVEQITPALLQSFQSMATKHRLDIIVGSHLTWHEGRLLNIAHLVRRDGTIARQAKLHITPSEKQSWQVEPGSRVEVFDTAKGRIAILICYDIEFPELARIATAKGADVIFVPFNTDLRSGYLRVRSCAQARCIEDNTYCVLAGAVGHLVGVLGSDQHYAQSCVLTPSDLAFPRDGIACEAEPGIETMIVQDLDLGLIRRSRTGGTVRTWVDRRADLYRLSYLGDGEAQTI